MFVLYELGCEPPWRPTRCLLSTSRSSEGRGLTPNWLPSPAGALLPGLLGRKLSAWEALANLGGDLPIEPLRACDREEGPGPGTEAPEAPAKGASPWASAPPFLEIGICPRVEGDPGEAARRAVDAALEGEPERCDSARREEDGMGLDLGEPGGLESFAVKRPAIVAEEGSVTVAEGSKFRLEISGWTLTETSSDNDEGQLRSSERLVITRP